MNEPSEMKWSSINNYIENILDSYSEFLSAEDVETVRHYLEHDEFEMAFEGLFLELIKINPPPPLLNVEECLSVGRGLKLNEESVFDGAFWDKFEPFVVASSKKS